MAIETGKSCIRVSLNTYDILLTNNTMAMVYFDTLAWQIYILILCDICQFISWPKLIYKTWWCYSKFCETPPLEWKLTIPSCVIKIFKQDLSMSYGTLRFNITLKMTSGPQTEFTICYLVLPFTHRVAFFCRFDWLSDRYDAW